MHPAKPHTDANTNTKNRHKHTPLCRPPSRAASTQTLCLRSRASTSRTHTWTTSPGAPPGWPCAPKIQRTLPTRSFFTSSTSTWRAAATSGGARRRVRGGACARVVLSAGGALLRTYSPCFRCLGFCLRVSGGTTSGVYWFFSPFGVSVCCLGGPNAPDLIPPHRRTRMSSSCTQLRLQQRAAGYSVPPGQAGPWPQGRVEPAHPREHEHLAARAAKHHLLTKGEHVVSLECVVVVGGGGVECALQAPCSANHHPPIHLATPQPPHPSIPVHSPTNHHIIPPWTWGHG